MNAIDFREDFFEVLSKLCTVKYYNLNYFLPFSRKIKMFM